MRRIGCGTIACIVVVFCVVSGIEAPAQTFTTLASFSDAEGLGPTAISQGTNGNFYGVASGGGKYGFGTVFEVAPSGKLTVLYNFCPQPNCADGASPSGLMQAGNGNYYGIAQSGGAGVSSVCHEYPVGCGTVFEITPGGQETVLYDFCSQPMCTDGQSPGGGLIQGVNGNLYGTTYGGGVSHSHFCAGTLNPCGTIFAITPSGTLTTLYRFCSQSNCDDGHIPYPLVEGADGNFYGTTGLGGANQDGTFFGMKPDGTLTTLYNFTYAETDGFSAFFTVQGVDGSFYGITELANSGGAILKMTPSGELTTLYTFCAAPCAGGQGPEVLIQGTDGNFYGITSYGGNSSSVPCRRSGCGTIFELTPTGQLTTLYNFCSQPNCTDGGFPRSLVQGTDGSLHGTTDKGGCASGKTGCGTAFRLTVGLGPFVKANPAFGKVGYSTSILGNNLTGATSVTFNGAPATFTVQSGSFIKATVPTGATSGTIEVTTPSGTLSSNVAFRVLP